MACLCCCKYKYFCQKQCSDLTWRFSLAYYYTAQITWFKTLHLFDTSLNGQENSVRDIRKWQAELFYIWLKIAMYYQHSQISLFIFSVQRSFKKEVKEKKEKKQKLNCWWDVEMQNLQDTAQKISHAEGMWDRRWDKRCFSSPTNWDEAELLLCLAEVSVSSAVLRFCSLLHGSSRSSWGSLHSWKSVIIFCPTKSQLGRPQGS